MFKTSNHYNGAQFEYENESGSCTASGNFRFAESNLENVNINGSLKKDDVTYAFSANRDNQGNVNIYNVHDYRVLAEVAEEVAAIIAHIEELNAKEEEE